MINTKLRNLRQMLPLYRNKSIDLYCTSIDWFLYDGNNVFIRCKHGFLIISGEMEVTNQAFLKKKLSPRLHLAK